MKKQPSLLQKFNEQFPDDEACLKHLMKTRYGGLSFECPKCKKTGRFTRLKNEPAYQCGRCGHHIHPMAGTLFHDSRTPLQKWFFAIHLFVMSRNGISAMELQRHLNVSYKTAWRIGQQIRKHIARINGTPSLEGVIEIDEPTSAVKNRVNAVAVPQAKQSLSACSKKKAELPRRLSKM